LQRFLPELASAWQPPAGPFSERLPLLPEASLVPLESLEERMKSSEQLLAPHETESMPSASSPQRLWA